MEDLAQLRRVVSELQSLNSHLAFLKSEELRGKRDVWERADGQSQTYRDKAATYSVVDVTTEVWRVEAEIKNLTEEKYLLLFILNNGK